MKNKTLFDKRYNELIADFFSEQRDFSGRTLEDVAFFMGLKPQTLYTYERGTRTMPISVFIYLCKFYDFDYKKVYAKLTQQALDECGWSSLKTQYEETE